MPVHRHLGDDSSALIDQRYVDRELGLAGIVDAVRDPLGVAAHDGVRKNRAARDFQKADLCVFDDRPQQKDPLTEHAGDGGARISSKHTLALVNPGGASSASLVGLAREIRNGVRQAFGVDLVNEPVLVGAEL